MNLKLYVATITEEVEIINRIKFTINSRPEDTDTFEFVFYDAVAEGYQSVKFVYVANGINILVPRPVPYNNIYMADIIAGYINLFNFSYKRINVIYTPGNNYFEVEPYNTDLPIISIVTQDYFTFTPSTISQPQYRLLNLFNDETINYTNKLTDIEKLSNIFTDVTNTFTIPADDNNLEIYKQYLDLDITNPINTNLRQPGLIELDTFTFRYGKITLESGTIVKGRPESLKVTFYGSLTQITDIIGDDTLSQLDYIKDDFGNLTKAYNNIGKFNFSYNLENVTKLIDGTTYIDSLMIPLIHLGTKEWNYGTGINNDVSQDIATTTGAIDSGTLRPALRVRELFTAIQQKYNIKFTNQFLDEAQFNNLYIWLNGSSSNRETFDFVTQFDHDGYYPDPLGYETTVDLSTNIVKIETFDVSSDPKGKNDIFSINVGWPFDSTGNLQALDGTNFSITMSFVDRRTATYGNVFYSETRTLSSFNDGTNAFNHFFQKDFSATELGLTIGNPLLFQIIYSVNKPVLWKKFRVVTEFSYLPPYDIFLYQYRSDNTTSQGANYNIGPVLPNMKVIDFIQGIMQMFKLIIRPLTTNIFELTTLDNYYAGGDLINITPDVDNETIEIVRPDIYKKIDLLFEKTNNVLGSRFRTINDPVGNKIGYGDLTFQYNSVDSKNTLEVKLPFENMLFERMLDDSNTPPTKTNILFGESISVSDTGSISENNSKPILFYNNGRTTISPVKFKFNTTIFTATQSYLIGNTNNEFLNQVTNTINWGAENDPWHLTRVDNSLYLNYWSRWIASIYDLRQKKLKVTANLSQKFLNRLSLNDTLIITNNKYRINDYTTNLLTGKTDFTLFRDFSQLSQYDFIDDLFIIDKTEFTFNKGTTYYSVNLVTRGKWEVEDVSGSGVVCITTSGYNSSEIVFKSSNNNSGSDRTIEFKIKTVDQLTYQEQNILITQLG